MSYLKKPKYQYFRWLCRQVTQGDYGKVSYKALLLGLHCTKFTWSKEVPKDRCRAMDALSMRNKFIERRHISPEDAAEIGDPYAPSVLEVLVAMCVRVETSIMANDKYGDRTSQWFWIIMSNLGMAHMNDKLFDPDEMDEILDKFMERKYDGDGQNGGAFPLKNPREDLRTTDLWYQFMWYLAENYPE